MMNINVESWVLILATLLGPVLAVQAQKWIERLREGRQRKLNLFFTLMATRPTRISWEHVRALNMIDIEFYRQQSVIDKWRIYHDHLGENLPDVPAGEWIRRGEELFMDLLFAMSQHLGYAFDRVQLKRGAYYPRAHGDEETTQREIRDSLAKILSGAKPFPITVTSISQEQGAPEQQRAIRTMLADMLTGKTPLQVVIKQSESGALS
jgi:hypothetical protein